MVNTNLGQATALVNNGSVTLSETLNDYPKLTIVEYGDADTSGTIYSAYGLCFVL